MFADSLRARSGRNSVVLETCRAKNTSIKLPSCIKLAFALFQYFEVFHSVHFYISDTFLTTTTTHTIFIYNIYLLCLFFTRFDVPHTIIYWDLTSLPLTFHYATAVLIIDYSCVAAGGFQ
jgi:hypothetical protein